MVAEGRTVHRLAIEGAAEERGHLAGATGLKELFKRIERKERGIVPGEASLPGRIGIQELSRRAERGNHLAGVLEQVAIAFLRLALGLVLAHGRALVHGHGHQADDGGVGVAQGGDMERDGDQSAILAAQLSLKAGYAAGRQTAQAFHAGSHAEGGGGRGRSVEAAKLFHLRNQAHTLAGSQNLHGAPLLHQFIGVVAQQAFGGGVGVGEVAIEADGDHTRAGRVQQISERLGGRRGFGLLFSGDWIQAQ